MYKLGSPVYKDSCYAYHAMKGLTLSMDQGWEYISLEPREAVFQRLSVASREGAMGYVKEQV